MAGWRIGAAFGKAEFLAPVLKFKSNMDSGMFLPLQQAAVKALSADSAWFANQNRIYRSRQKLVFELLDLLDCVYDPAQSGMFVSAENMKYYPYKKIFTRISGMDNIYKGMSSFTVEMTELRNILQRCNKFSLVIGDEICCGTESISGIAIVSAGIDTLINKGASFIFATHLHELTTMSCIKEHINNNRLHVKHMLLSIWILCYKTLCLYLCFIILYEIIVYLYCLCKHLFAVWR
jgi:hypothetical protein